MNLAIFHNGLFIAILAHALIGVSLVWDKVLLRKPQTKDLAAYVFWLGFISVFGLCLIPFGFKFPGWGVAWLGFGAGIIHLAANYLYYAALKKGEASETLAMMGGFSPVFTALIGIRSCRNRWAKATSSGSSSWWPAASSCSSRRSSRWAVF